MDNLLLISNIVLWVAVIGLGLLVFALTRQIGVLYERIAPAGALMMNQKLERGSVAPKVNVQDLNSGNKLTVGAGGARSQLLFFLSPDCPVCKTLLPIVKSVQQAESSWLEIVLASDGNLAEQKSFIQQAKLSSFIYVNSEILGKQYGVSKLPFAVLINPQGQIVSFGLVNSREHFESLFESMESGYASIQAYMQGQKNPVTATALGIHTPSA